MSGDWQKYTNNKYQRIGLSYQAKSVKLAEENTLLQVKLQTAMSMNASLESEITKLREVLFKAGATTHKCKELFDWYEENA